MSATYQTVASLAIVVGLLGTWLAGRNKAGWLLCVVSSTMWLPALLAGQQWAAVANCGLSIGICVRNFTTGTSTTTTTPMDRELGHAGG